MRHAVLGWFTLVFFAGILHAQTFSTHPCGASEGNTSNSSGWFSIHQEKVCELRQTTLPLRGTLNVSGTNGGIEVVGEERADVFLEARVVAQASSRADAESLLHDVHIQTDGNIEAKGPSTSGWSRRSWYVNYRLLVPRHLAARLRTENGGIDLAHLEGSIQADTTNGGLTLQGLAGDVHATTVNGGVDVTLEGDRWRGGGLFASSTNGGVSVKAHEHYSAHLIADTTNGGISVSFPVTVKGSIHNHIDTNIGQGGAPVHLETVNGGVSVDQD